MHQALPSAPICPALCELVGPARINECVECSPSIADSCPANQVCNPGSGICVPCLENSDCDGNAGGNLCFVHPTSPALNACVPCLEDEGGCPTGQVCKLDGNGGNSCVACLDSDNSRMVCVTQPRTYACPVLRTTPAARTPPRSATPWVSRQNAWHALRIANAEDRRHTAIRRPTRAPRVSSATPRPALPTTRSALHWTTAGRPAFSATARMTRTVALISNAW